MYMCVCMDVRVCDGCVSVTGVCVVCVWWWGGRLHCGATPSIVVDNLADPTNVAWIAHMLRSAFPVLRPPSLTPQRTCMQFRCLTCTASRASPSAFAPSPTLYPGAAPAPRARDPPS